MDGLALVEFFAGELLEIFDGARRFAFVKLDGELLRRFVLAGAEGDERDVIGARRGEREGEDGGGEEEFFHGETKGSGWAAMRVSTPLASAGRASSPPVGEPRLR